MLTLHYPSAIALVPRPHPYIARYYYYWTFLKGSDRLLDAVVYILCIIRL